jgi:hypothetical protein
MTIQLCPNRTAAKPVDLLPWADPYIAQLFADAGLVSDAAPSESPLRAAWQDARAACKASLDAMLPSESWRVKSPRRARLSRTRRTKPARLLARCKAPAA